MQDAKTDENNDKQQQTTRIPPAFLALSRETPPTGHPEEHTVKFHPSSNI